MQKQNNYLPLITIATLILVFIASYISLQPPKPVGPSNDQFSAESALERLAEIHPENHQPHPVNSAANSTFRQTIIKHMENLGLEVEIQSAIGCNNQRNALSCAPIKNLITQIPGTDSSQTLLLMAHYDSVPAGSGAADAGHAVAIILELLELLSDQPPAKNDLIILFNEGEEAGLLGAEAFMKEHPLAKKVDVVINMEARGNQGISLLFETGEDNYALMKRYQQFAKRPFSNSITYEIYKLLPNDTDLTVFKRYGITGVNFAFQGRVSHYHTPLDNMENLSPGSVQHQGDNTWAMLLSLLNSDLETLPEGNAVYTDVLSSFMIVWPEYMTIPLTFFAGFLIILICWQLIASKAINLNQLVTSLPFSFAVVVISALSCWLLLFIAQTVSGQSQPWLSIPIPMRMAIWLFPYAVTLFIANKYKGKLDYWGLILAPVWLLFILSAASSLTMPGLSYLPLLPLLLFSILISVLFVLGQMNNHLLINAATLVSTVAMAIFVFPMLFLLEDAMGFRIAPVFGLLSSLVIILALPLLLICSQPVLKRLIIFVTGISLSGLMICTQQDGFSPTHPQHINFEYLQQGTSASIQTLTRYPLPEKMIAESAFSNNQKISRPWSMAEYPSIDTAFLDLPEPELSVISSNDTENTRQLTLRYSSARSIDHFILHVNSENKIEQLTFDKMEQDSYFIPSAFDSQYFLCSGESCNGMEFTLEISNQQNFQVGIVDYSFSLPESLEYLKHTRGKNAQPVQKGDVTAIHKSFTFPVIRNSNGQ